MSVAIRTATRLQDQDDVNVTPGVGVDEYALTYDHDTGKFVLRAPAAGGLLATGATTGATAQAQAFTVGVSLADTTTSTSGVIFKNADRFIHNFHHPTGQTAVPEGYNTFIGVLAGNFTTGSTATQTYHSSGNVAIGYRALIANTTGYRNVAVGRQALEANTTGDSNVAIGQYALVSNTTGFHNMAQGLDALRGNTQGNQNIAVGAEALYANTTGSENIAIGVSALRSNVSNHSNVAVGKEALFSATHEHNVAVGTAAGYGISASGDNVFIGWHAGLTQADGATALAVASNSIYIGSAVRGFNNSDSNSIVIGYQAIGLGANTTVIGNTSTTMTALPGGGLRLTEMAAPTGSADNATIYTKDNGAGKTQLCVKLGDDVEIVLATQA